MKRREQVKLLLEKAAQDESLLDQVLGCDRVSNEIIGFHCQQAAEKLLKALLTGLGATYHRTHNLRLLMDLLADAGHPVRDDLQGLDELTPFGVLLRYETPPVSASLDRPRARDMIRRLRVWVEEQLRAAPDG